MLKDKLFNIMKSSQNTKYLEGMRGEVEIKAWRKGELFYHDGGSNTVTVWARHANMHMLSGNSYSNRGDRSIGAGIVTARSQPAIDGHVGNATNNDGTLISGGQFLWPYEDYTTTCKPENPAADTAGYIYPFFPTKMLFGTGYEFTSFSSLPTVPAAFQDFSDFTQAEFDDGKKDSDINYYSNTVVAKEMLKTRTINDISSGSIPDDIEMIYSDKLLYSSFVSHTGIDGAIKNDGIVGAFGTPLVVTNEFPGTPGDSYNTMTNTVTKAYRGIGRPAFIYSRRGATSEVAITADGNKEFNNRITFTVIMPEQTNEIFQYYPYNDWTLKEAGLFCDASLVRKAEGDVIPGPETFGYTPYNCMPQGIMIAKRKITPITKTIDVKISISWSLYL